MAGDRTESRVAEDDERFQELLAEVDAIAREAALAPVEHRFRQNDKALAAMLSQDRPEHRARFSLDGGLRVARLSPLAVSQLNLRPGQAFDVPGEAMEVLRRVGAGTVPNGQTTGAASPTPRHAWEEIGWVRLDLMKVAWRGGGAAVEGFIQCALVNDAL